MLPARSPFRARACASELAPSGPSGIGSPVESGTGPAQATDEEVRMHARIVRFTGVTPERVQELTQRLEEADGPPPGVDSQSIKLFYDESQGTAVVTVFFDDEQKMRDADSVFQ